MSKVAGRRSNVGRRAGCFIVTFDIGLVIVGAVLGVGPGVVFGPGLLGGGGVEGACGDVGGKRLDRAGEDAEAGKGEDGAYLLAQIFGVAGSVPIDLELLDLVL